MRHYQYRDYNNEKPPKDPEWETKEERVKRILDSMPESIFNNPELRLKALRRANEK
jgi:hypothetical protein